MLPWEDDVDRLCSEEVVTVFVIVRGFSDVEILSLPSDVEDFSGAFVSGNFDVSGISLKHCKK